MHRLNHAANRLYAMKHLIFACREWRRYLQDHEVVSTYLRQDVLMIKQPHHKDLSESSRMDRLECLEGNPHRQVAWGLELNPRQHAFATHLFHHLVLTNCCTQSLAKFVSQGVRARNQPFLLKNIHRRDTSTHRQRVFTKRGSMDERPA